MKKTFNAPKVSEIELLGNVILAESTPTQVEAGVGGDVSDVSGILAPHRGIFD